MENRDVMFVDPAYELIDTYTWEKHCKIITRDIHRIGGLFNFSHFNHIVSGAPTPTHVHMDAMEIHCMVKGRRDTFLYTTENTERHSYAGNEAFIVHPGELHSSGINAQNPCEFYALQLNLREKDHFLGLSREQGNELVQRLTKLEYRRLQINAAGINLLRTAFRLMSTGDVNAGAAYIVSFLFGFVSQPPSPAGIRRPVDVSIEMAEEYIKENISEPLSLSELAKVSGYSLSRFKSKFREETGQTPAAYITAAKVARAKELLDKTDRSVTEIAMDLSWTSSNYFCTVFKKLTGISPLQYRKQEKE